MLLDAFAKWAGCLCAIEVRWQNPIKYNKKEFLVLAIETIAMAGCF